MNKKQEYLLNILNLFTAKVNHGTRAILRGVLVERNFIVATNGRSMCVVKNEEDGIPVTEPRLFDKLKKGWGNYLGFSDFCQYPNWRNVVFQKETMRTRLGEFLVEDLLEKVKMQKKLLMPPGSSKDGIFPCRFGGMLVDRELALPCMIALKRLGVKWCEIRVNDDPVQDWTWNIRIDHARGFWISMGYRAAEYVSQFERIA